MLGSFPGRQICSQIFAIFLAISKYFNELGGLTTKCDGDQNVVKMGCFPS